MAVSNKNVRIKITIPKTVKAVMDEVAAQRGVSLSAVAAEVIVDFYNGHVGEKTAVSSNAANDEANETD